MAEHRPSKPSMWVRSPSPAFVIESFLFKCFYVIARIFLLVLDELLQNLQGPVENGRGGGKNNQLGRKYYICVSTFICGD